MKNFLCWIGWHSIFTGFEPVSFDGCSIHARCKWCGGEGLIDSQGNLFAVRVQSRLEEAEVRSRSATAFTAPSTERESHERKQTREVGRTGT
jgi:hypothetical protein